MVYYFLFDNTGNQKTYANDIKGLQDLGSWVEFEGDFNPEKDLARLVDGTVVIDKDANVAKNALEIAKKIKIKQLNDDYNYSKKIILQNGNTLVIDHDTPEREFFINNLENLKRIEEAQNSVLSYRQKVDNVYLGFSALSYIWKYLFLNRFTKERPSLTLEDKRGKNKEIFDIKKLKIENSNSIEELQAITWSFESFTIININLEAQKLLDGPETPAYVIEAINKLKGEDGQIHLIKEL